MSQIDANAEQALAAGSDEVTIEGITPIDETDPADPTKARFVGVVALVASVTVSWIAARMADTWCKEREQGVQIDMRAETPVISRIAGAPNGTMVIIHPDSKVETQKMTYDTPKEFEGLLSRVLKVA